MPNVFISYRLCDVAQSARWIRDRLELAVGPGSVYMDDCDPQVSLGVHFDRRAQERLKSTGVVLVVIGPAWLNATDDTGQHRLENPDDVVRVELERALRAGAVVIPVLVDDATMPTPEQLPETLAPLTRRAAVRLDQRDDAGMGDLLAAIERSEPRVVALQAVSTTLGPFETVVGPGRGRPQRRHPSDARLTMLLEHAVRHGVIPAGVPVALATTAPTPEAAIPCEDEGYAPAPPAPVPAASSRASSRRGSVVWLTLGAGAALVAVLYELARQIFGSLAFAAESLPSRDSAGEGDLVGCTVFAPGRVRPGESALIQVFAHLAEQTEDARALATEFDPGAQRRAYRSLEAPVPRGASLTFELHIPGAGVDQPIETLTWRGRAESVQFEVVLPQISGPLIGTIWISRDGGPLGHVKFKLAVHPDAGSAEPLPVGDAAIRYTAAFVSYASVDRDEVLRRVQMLQALKIPYFKDLLDLEPGDRWWPRLQSAIEQCDLFLLFWSSDAKRSEWVRKEVLHALARQAGDQLSPPEIRPVILHGPPIVRPWDELSHLHFNDKLLYFMSPPATAGDKEEMS